MISAHRVWTINNNETHGDHKYRVLQWCAEHNLDISYFGRTLGEEVSSYIWKLSCSDEELLFFIIAWGAKVEGIIKKEKVA